MHIIKIGDVVQILGEITPMTVVQILDDNVGDIEALCYWYNKDSSILKKAQVPLRLLKIANERES